MNLFLGKFGTKYPEQIEGKYYAAGDEGSSYYGGVKPGDYVFPSHDGKIIGLWKAKEYTKMKKTVHSKDDGVLLFDEIKTYEEVSVTNDFTRIQAFYSNLDLVNKVTKSVKGLGFIPIQTSTNCPHTEDIDFKSSVINLYVFLEEVECEYSEGDIRVK